MDQDALAELLSDTTDPSLIVQSQQNRPDSPLHNYSSVSVLSAPLHTQQQRLLSTLDDQSFLKLVNSYELSPHEKRSLLGHESDSEPQWESDGSHTPSTSRKSSSEPDHSASVPSSPETSTDNSDPSPGAPHIPVQNLNFGDYGQYFSDKKVLQQDRDAHIKKLYQDALNNGQPFPPVFKDCIIYINGRTDPDRLQLHQKIVLYGGQFMHFLSGKTSVTHIIASNLTAKKRVEFQKYKVVTPSWIVDSIAATKRLPWQDYALITGDHGQRKLDLNIARRSNSESAPQVKNSEDSVTTLDCKHPDFLQSFFAKSRLHHLSTWKADLRALFCQKYIEHGDVKSISENEKVAIFHVDFDCFFATVSALSDPRYKLYKDPLAVAHGTNSSEIASCNYVARSFGVKNGMWVRSARRLCPKLICMPYNFEQYEINSKLLYQILAGMQFFDMILPISIDEAICVKKVSSFPDHHDVEHQCEMVTSAIRQQVFDATNGCTVSIGCGPSLVSARLALKEAKPNGQCVVMNLTGQIQVDNFQAKFTLKDLPGIGSSIVDKICKELLPDASVTPTIGDLKAVSSLKSLTSILGTKTGRKLHMFLSGKDDEENSRILRDPLNFFARKSISVDINYAIRFDTIHEIDDFIDRVCQHLTSKIHELGLVTPQVTLKVMRRCEHAPIEPAKYLGSGECDTFSRSSRFGVPTDEMGLIATEIKSSFRMLACPSKDLRGLAVQLNKLEKKSARHEQRKFAFADQLPTLHKDAEASALRPNAFHSLPQTLKEDVRSELIKRHIQVPLSPSRNDATSTSPVKEYWDKFGKQRDTFKQEMPSSLDEDFMRNLPSQIQREIKRDHAIVKKTRSSVRKRDVNKEEAASKSWLNHRSTLTEVDKFQALERPRDIYNLIGTWIDQTISVGPHADDLDLFDRYLDRLASKWKSYKVLQIARAMSSRLEYHASFTAAEPRGRQEWEEYLLRRMIPKLHSSCSARSPQVQFEL
ncbi:LAME_0B01354g1_1 [Lachancea meyersii CBS 8951]|uniref:DNA repair protein REV1 n=1 Tax=Lachancea meyersii CBS 8951 TaxID=1266667 RepID=A0A1G4ITM9_9SACH|nr:LAME_0B01354g1_1 [Lachancea meyersii CBS 8951]